MLATITIGSVKTLDITVYILSEKVLNQVKINGACGPN